MPLNTRLLKLHHTIRETEQHKGIQSANRLCCRHSIIPTANLIHLILTSYVWYGQHSLGWRNWRLIGVSTLHLPTTFLWKMRQFVWQWTGMIGTKHAHKSWWHKHDCVYTQKAVPRNIFKDVTNGKLVCGYKEKKEEPNRTQLIVFGNRMNYPGDCITPAEYLLIIIDVVPDVVIWPVNYLYDLNYEVITRTSSNCN